MQPQLHNIKINTINQVQSLQPVLHPQSLLQPQSLPPKNLLNIFPPECISVVFRCVNLNWYNHYAHKNILSKRVEVVFNFKLITILKLSLCAKPI